MIVILRLTACVVNDVHELVIHLTKLVAHLVVGNTFKVLGSYKHDSHTRIRLIRAIREKRTET